MKRLAIACLCLGILTASAASAGEKPEWRTWPNGDRLLLSVGYYRPFLDTVVSAQPVSDPLLGTRISFERNLGLEDTKGVPQASLLWRISKRNQLRLAYFELDRSGADVSGVDIRFGDQLFEANLPVQSFFDIRTLELSYAFSVIADRKKTLSLGVGVSLQELGLGLRGTADLPDPLPDPLPPNLPQVEERLDVTAPLPTLDIRFSYAITEKWLIDLRGGWLSLGLDFDDNEDIEGRILNGDASLRYKAFNNLGIFFSLSAFDVRVDYRKRDLEARLEYDYWGPVIGLEAFF